MNDKIDCIFDLLNGIDVAMVSPLQDKELIEIVYDLTDNIRKELKEIKKKEFVKNNISNQIEFEKFWEETM